jgi:Uri superfamily endonuclease
LLAEYFPGGRLVEGDGIDTFPGYRGAYVLGLHLREAVEVRSGKTQFDLLPGWYAYAGSARGPGGVRARLGRHFRRDKRRHWHVDQLTLAAGTMFGLAIEGGSECELASRLARSGAFEFPIGGFGSSDCRDCPSHLLGMRDSG